MGGFLLNKRGAARQAAERVFDRYETLARRRHRRAGVLSGGERRLLEISRALIMEPEVLLVDEPSIGLEPRFIDMVFEILADLQHRDGKTIVMVEQNARRAWSSPISAMCSSRAASPWPGPATPCSKTRRSGASSWAREATSRDVCRGEWSAPDRGCWVTAGSAPFPARHIVPCVTLVVVAWLTIAT